MRKTNGEDGRAESPGEKSPTRLDARTQDTVVAEMIAARQYPPRLRWPIEAVQSCLFSFPTSTTGTPTIWRLARRSRMSSAFVSRRPVHAK